LHGPGKRDEIKQPSINRWEIGFIPFFRTNVMYNRGIAKKDIPVSIAIIQVGIGPSITVKNSS
jgi:hypothetical protein